VAWDFIPRNHALEELAHTCDVVCFGTLAQRKEQSLETIQTFLGYTRKDTLRICDCNLRQNFYTSEIIEQSLYVADVVKLNSNELALLAGSRPSR